MFRNTFLGESISCVISQTAYCSVSSANEEETPQDLTVSKSIELNLNKRLKYAGIRRLLPLLPVDDILADFASIMLLLILKVRDGHSSFLEFHCGFLKLNVQSVDPTRPVD